MDNKEQKKNAPGGVRAFFAVEDTD